MSESSNPNVNPPGEFKPDPTTDHPHNLEKKAGATVGVIAGAAVGTIVAGPIGTAIGAVLGATVGGIAGKVGGEMFDPSSEADYWLKHHATQPYVKPDTVYSDYEPAYRAGYGNYTPGETFEQAEPDLIRFYEGNGGAGRLDWNDARPAAKAAWERLAGIFPREAFNHI